MKTKAYTIALLFAGTAVTAQAATQTEAMGQTYDPVSNYYETYYGVSEAAASTAVTPSQNADTTAARNAYGQTYDPVADYYDTYYGLSEITARVSPRQATQREAVKQYGALAKQPVSDEQDIWTYGWSGSL
jgi:hypothetical protein